MTVDRPPIVLGRQPIVPEDIVSIASGRAIELGEEARAAMTTSRDVLEKAMNRGDPIYGVTRGVGALKTVTVDADEQAAFNRALLLSHNVGRGPLAPTAVVRATMAARAAGLSLGYAGVRARVVDALCAALNAGITPGVHTIGSVGQADLSQMAEIGLALTGQAISADALRAKGVEPLDLAPREAHAILNSNAYTVGAACLAADRARRAVAAMERCAALSYEAVLGNVDALHPQIFAARPYPGDEIARAHLVELLEGGALADRRRPPRNLQDALCFKGLAQTQGAAHGALSHLHDQLTIELNASGDSAFVLVDEDRAISTGGHEIAPVALALDHARLALAGVATIAGERIQKLLDPRFTDLPAGLRLRVRSAEDGLAIVGVGAASLAASIRLLAAPVTLEQPTSSLAEGIEDRVTMAPFGAARLDEMSGLLIELAAIEAMCAAQAMDLRESVEDLGRGTRTVYRLVRRHIPSGGLPPDVQERLDRVAAALEDPDAAVDEPPARDDERLATLSYAPGPLTPEQCRERARLAADALDLSTLDRAGVGEAVLLWRSDSSEAWLNLWWEPRDTGYHDHDGSCVGVYVIEGVARNEALMYGQPRRMHEYRAGESFSFGNDGIHRMEHDPGAITIHVYSPPIRELGHYELVDGMLQRTAGGPEDPSPPSPHLVAGQG